MAVYHGSGTGLLLFSVQGVVALPLKILLARAALLLLRAAVGNCSCTYVLLTLLQEALTLTKKRAGC